MKILLLDIETAPNTAYVWRLFKENIGLNQILETGYVMCWAAKWYGEEKVYFSSVHHDSEENMLAQIHELLEQADCVVHFNGKSFDIPTLNKEFVTHGITPPAPYKQVDLLEVARATFRFTSNKLDFIAEQLGVGKKHETTFKLWVDCMNNKPEAWDLMEKYNKNDVILLEKVYEKFRPWIRSHANHSLHNGEVCCPNCGSRDYQRRGFYFTVAGKYQRYQCQKCYTWFRVGSTLAAKPAGRATALGA